MANEKVKEQAAKEVDENVYLQFSGREISISDIRHSVREDYDKAKKGEDKPEKIRIYLKPEDSKAYYVINDDYAGEITF